MEEQPSPPASSGDNFGSFFQNPSPSDSPSFQREAPFLAHDGQREAQSPAPPSPSSVSRSASSPALGPVKPSFMASWGLFQSEEASRSGEAVRHPLMGGDPLIDSDDEIPTTTSLVSPKKPPASASSTTKTTSASTTSPAVVSSGNPSNNPDLLQFSGLSLYQTTSNVTHLRKLARQGAWRTLVEKVKDAKKRGALAMPDEEVTYGTYHLLALMKLRSYGAAADELVVLGDLDSPHYQYEQHPLLYPGKSGSMVPFALRCMHAELPHRTGQTSTTMERLYALLAHCNSRIESLQAASAGSTNVFAPSDTPTINDVPAEEKDVNVELVEGNPEGGKEEAGDEKFLEEVSTSREEEDFGEFVASETATTVSAAVKPLLVWMRRKEAVIYNLVSHHLHQKQFVVALQWLNRLLARTPTDGNLLSKVGYVQLQLGDIEGAQLTFSKVEALLSDPPSDTLLINLVGRNRGLLHFAEKQYSKAFDEFNAVLGRDPTDAVSANNKALCLMYSRELLGATQVLEDCLQTSPQSTLNETVVLNLCSMYELTSINSSDAKRTLSTWLLNHAPDDFDLSCTRL
jgi:Flp pilus assembly protein TadD